VTADVTPPADHRPPSRLRTGVERRPPAAGRPVGLDLLGARIRAIPDHPTPGLGYKDITPLLLDPLAFPMTNHGLAAQVGDDPIDKVVGIEARGFIVAAPVAYHFGAGFVPVRKAGKLPYESMSQDYELEYGTDTLEVHADAFDSDDRVLIVDDVLATGGTARAACQLVERAGATVTGLAFVIELGFLKGAEKIQGYEAQIDTAKGLQQRNRAYTEFKAA
jgi:adenine phosphoribosyltransferase